MKLYIDPRIEKAETPPSEFYLDDKYFEHCKEQIFRRCWHFVPGIEKVSNAWEQVPIDLLDGFLDEPLLLSVDEQQTRRFLSNVCTHRGNLLVNHQKSGKSIICSYHGRRFSVSGQFEFMPEFQEVEDFPRSCDHLKAFSSLQWGPWSFVGLSDDIPFKKVLEVMDERVGHLPLNEFIHSPQDSKDYLVNAHWALYCDNYLEGFHIPFVHKGLNAVLDYGSYETLLFDYCNLQIGYADGGVEVFDLPEGHIDYGKNVAAYYFWVFPNMMFNFYPWGLSVNIVKPITKEKTRVSFISYVWDESKLSSSAGAELDKVEREDEFVVENVQKGLKSGAYHTGRYSVKRERGVHHFHSLLSQVVSGK